MEKYTIDQSTSKTYFNKKITIGVVLLLFLIISGLLYWQWKEAIMRQQVTDAYEADEYHPFKIMEAEKVVFLRERIKLGTTLENHDFDSRFLPFEVKTLILGDINSAHSVQVTYTPTTTGYVTFYSSELPIEEVTGILFKKNPTEHTLTSSLEKYIGAFEFENSMYSVKTHIVYQNGGSLVKIFAIKK